MTVADRQRKLEALGWTFERRNSQWRWVRFKSNTNRQLAKLVAWAEAIQEMTSG